MPFLHSVKFIKKGINLYIPTGFNERYNHTKAPENRGNLHSHLKNCFYFQAGLFL